MYSIIGIVRQKSYQAIRFLSLSKSEESTDPFEDAEAVTNLIKRRKSKSAKQNSLEDIEQSTRLGRNEIRTLYRSFKQAYPAGFITMDNISEILLKTFPDGYVGPYAELLHSALDKDINGQVTFREMCSLAALVTNGTVYNKLLWAFKMYDTDHDGAISREDLTRVLIAVYRLLGDQSIDLISRGAVSKHVDWLFERLDTDGDGVIEKNEFLENCERDPEVCEGMLMYVNPSQRVFHGTNSHEVITDFADHLSPQPIRNKLERTKRNRIRDLPQKPSFFLDPS